MRSWPPEMVALGEQAVLIGSSIVNTRRLHEGKMRVDGLVTLDNGLKRKLRQIIGLELNSCSQTKALGEHCALSGQDAQYRWRTSKRFLQYTGIRKSAESTYDHSTSQK